MSRIRSIRRSISSFDRDPRPRGLFAAGLFSDNSAGNSSLGTSSIIILSSIGSLGLFHLVVKSLIAAGHTVMGSRNLHIDWSNHVPQQKTHLSLGSWKIGIFCSVLLHSWMIPGRTSLPSWRINSSCAAVTSRGSKSIPIHRSEIKQRCRFLENRMTVQLRDNACVRKIRKKSGEILNSWWRSAIIRMYSWKWSILRDIHCSVFDISVISGSSRQRRSNSSSFK